MFTNAKSKILFAGWTWVTLGSNKLKEKTIYDEKQRVAITEQRQYDLLSNVVSSSGRHLVYLNHDTMSHGKWNQI